MKRVMSQNQGRSVYFNEVVDGIRFSLEHENKGLKCINLGVTVVLARVEGGIAERRFTREGGLGSGEGEYKEMVKWK